MFFEFIRYNLVGIINTVVGFSIIFTLMFFGVAPTISNGVGYGVGSIVSFYLNSKYTFKFKKSSRVVVLRFFMVLAISYILNYVALKYLLFISFNPYLAQVISAVIYTINSFLLMKFTVFRSK